MDRDKLTRSFDYIGVPAIIVEDMPSTPPLTTRDVTLANRESMGFGDASPSPKSYQSPDFSLGSETPSKSGRGLRRNRRISDMSMLSTDLGYQYPCVSIQLPKTIMSYLICLTQL